MKHYVIDQPNKLVSHEGSKESCEQYISTCQSLWGHSKSRYKVVEGAAARKKEVGF